MIYCVCLEGDITPLLIPYSQPPSLQLSLIFVEFVCRYQKPQLPRAYKLIFSQSETLARTHVRQLTPKHTHVTTIEKQILANFHYNLLCIFLSIYLLLGIVNKSDTSSCLHFVPMKC